MRSDATLRSSIDSCQAPADLHVVEWSAEQCAIHMTLLAPAIELNQQMALQTHREPSDYVVIGVFTSHEEATAFADMIEPALKLAREDRIAAGCVR